VTYSIVARDPETRQLGVAVQTAMPAAGATIPWARPGVGVVATQAIGEPAYGTWCLDALAAGHDADAALATAAARDPLPPLRQVAVVGTDGPAAAMTGELCIDHAGHVVGDGFAVQANMMRSTEVWPAMAEAYRHATGPLARRLLATLVAAEAAGGDARGRMSAALVVVDGVVPELPGSGVVLDARVDRSDDPLAELTRLVDVADGYARFHAAVAALMAGDGATALAEADTGLVLLPGETNLEFVRAGALAAAGETGAAADQLRALVREQASWATLARSFAAKGLLTLPEGFSLDDL